MTPMHMKNRLSIWLIILNLLIVVSCEDPEDKVGLNGELIGRIETFNEFGEPLNDHSGYEVTAEGTQPLMKATTDGSGEFILSGLPTGTYNLLFEKEGFQTRKIFSYRFVGGNVPTYFDLTYLSQLPSTAITSFAASVTDENNPDPDKYTIIRIEYTIAQTSSATHPRYVAVFLGSSDKVSGETYDQQINLSMGDYDYKVEKLQRGTKLYAKAYAVPVFCNGYYDFNLSTYINSCLGMSTEVLEIDVPL